MAWPTIPGSGDLTIDGSFKVASTQNILIGENSNIMSGQNVIAIGNAITAPSSLGSISGGTLYAENGHLFWLGSSGTLTNVASA